MPLIDIAIAKHLNYKVASSVGRDGQTHWQLFDSYGYNVGGSFYPSLTEEAMWQEQTPKFSEDLRLAIVLFHSLPNAVMFEDRVGWGPRISFPPDPEVTEFIQSPIQSKTVALAIARAYCRYKGIKYE